MDVNASLLLSIALGIIVAKALLYLFKDTIQAVKLRLGNEASRVEQCHNR
jgi:hypothetical protein